MMNMAASALGATAELIVALKLKDQLSGPLRDANHQLDALNRQSLSVDRGFRKIGAGLATGVKVAAVAAIGLGTAVGAIAINATNEALKFQADMELIHTQAHASQQEVAAMTQALIAMAGQVGTTPDELAAGLYHLESAGFRGAQALDALKIAAEGAKVGHANLEDVTNALDAVLVAGGKDATDMSGSMGQLNAIVGAGDMRMQDLADAMGTGILGVAHTFGLRLTDVGAALAVFGDNNIRGADAATKLRQAIVMMGAPTNAAAKHLKEIGLTQLQLADDMRKGGLVAAFVDLKKHLDAAGLTASQQADVIARSFGGGRTGAGIMLLLDQLTRLQGKEKDVADGAGAFGADWAAQQQTVQQAKDNMAAAFDALRLQLGTQLLPVAANVMGALAKFFQDPTTISAVKDFGQGLASMFSPANLAAALKFGQQVIPRLKELASQILPPLEAGMRITAGVAKDAFDMFSALPSGVQSIVIAALAGNKLTGGLVSSGIADIGKALAKGIIGGTTGALGGGIAGALAKVGLGKAFVQPVFVTNPGFGGGVGGAVEAGGEAAAGAGLTVAGVGSLIAGAIALPVVLTAVHQNLIMPELQRQAGQNISEVQGVLSTGDRLKMQEALSGIEDSVAHLNPIEQVLYNLDAQGVKTHVEGLEQALKDGIAAASGPQLIGEHSALGPQLTAAVNSMGNLTSKNLTAFRAGERDQTNAVAALGSRLQGSVAMVGDAIRHIPPPQVHVPAPVVNVAVATTVSVRDQTVRTSQYYRYGRANAV